MKTIKCDFEAPGELLALLEEFRLMCNDALRMAVTARPKNRFELIKLGYPRLKEYGLHSHYILSACEVAYSVYKNKARKTNHPFIKRPFLKLDNQSYTLNHLILRIPSRPRHSISLALNTSDYHLSFIDDKTLKRGSITVTGRSINIAFSREVISRSVQGSVGIDINERNTTTSDTNGTIVTYDTSQVAEIKENYRLIRAKIGGQIGRDKRISQRLFAKYGRREKNRTLQAINRISKSIVSHASLNNLEIKMERLKGIRRRYLRGNGQGPSFRGRMNSWTFYEIQRQLGYKAQWLGIPTFHLNPSHTSQNCSKCSSQLQPLERRILLCPSCGAIWDRDVNASRNIMAASVCAARPSRGSSEEEPRGQEKASDSQSRWMEVELRHKAQPGRTLG